MFLIGDEVKDYVDGIIHEETQLAEKGVDLTVGRVSRPASPTELDFGGSEEKRCQMEEITPRKRAPEDDYGWWKLEDGVYIIDFNETLDVSDRLGMVVPLERLTSGGSFHAPLLFGGELSDQPLLFVGSAGLKLKENARISRLLVWG